ncbi:glycosyltransferase [Microbacterium sediminis]|uniref:Uncharacterized protein n=1 Tax=Microbacterium sediminis TaxID=904291 RepID=A0A1B9NGP9_9MICO|nr:glycosyltransferase [Microbacterium sediminis]OCG75766.1 hypothetical protein A7J15_01590 [Microbacterium sediminis]QBR74159.1 glycosyltransferase [Microbacterium sediminis]
MTLAGGLPEHTAAAAPEALADVVFTFSYESFADAHRRGMMRPPDRLVSTLMVHPGVRRLLVADPYRSWGSAWARAIIDRPHTPRPTERLALVRPRRLARADPEAIEDIERTYRRYERALIRSSERAGLDAPYLITTNPLVAGFADADWTSGVLYYGRDDWLSSPARRRYWPAYREAYRRIAERGHAVAAVSGEIIERIGPTGPHAVVPNGIEPAEWLQQQPTPPDWYARIPAPRAVYVGTLDSRLDVDGIRELATRRPELQIVLIGPAPDARFLAPLRPLRNVHTRGLIGRTEIVAVLRNAELTLLAHRRTALTEAMSPLKVFEYLAAGRTVLATDLRPLHGLGDRVLLTPTVADFADRVDEALGLGAQTEAERRAYIADNAWPSRHRQILRLLPPRSASPHAPSLGS